MIGAVITDGSLNGTRVLVAHPSDVARRGLRAVLEPLGCVVTEAATAAETLGGAGEAGADVLLLDGALDGLLADVKGDPDLFRIAVVLVGEPPGVQAALRAL